MKSIFHALFISVFISFLILQPASAACRLALVLALDVSGSVDDAEYYLQRDGLANALLEPEVQDLILIQPHAPVSIAVFEWSSDDHQQLIQNWIEVNSVDDLSKVAYQIRTHRKNRATLKTAIGSAIRFAHALLDQKKDCWQHTIDVSGDGINNDGETPKDIYKALGFETVTVNGLIVDITLPDTVENPVFKGNKDLKAYYDTEIIHGSGAFSIKANGYDDYARAMKKKLLKELAPSAVSENNTLQKSDQRPL